MAKQKIASVITLSLGFASMLGAYRVQPSVAALANQKTTITWWYGSWLSDGRAQKLVADFEKQNPDIIVKATPVDWNGMHEKFLSSLISRQAPDVISFTSSWGQEYSATGGLADLTSTIKQVGANTFYPGTLDWATLGGKEYGVPFRMDTKLLFYNKDMFKKAGITHAPQTWTELEQDAKKLTGNGVYGLTIPLDKSDVQSGVTFRTVLTSFGGDYINKNETKATFNSPNSIKALGFYSNLFTKDKVLPPDTLSKNNDETGQLFAAGKAAMTFDGPWGIKTYDKAKLNYGVVLIPGVTKGKPGTWDSQGWDLGVSVASKNQDAAIKFIKFYIQPNNDAFMTDALPAVRKASTAKRFSTPNLKIFMKSLQYTHPIMKTSAAPAIYQAATVGLQRIFTGEDVKTVANDVNNTIQDLLNRNK